MTAHRIVVAGRVQGVGFRYYTSLAASGLGVNGWVKNLPDGTVEIMAETPGASLLHQFVDTLWEGPGHVDEVRAEAVEPQGFVGFRIDRTRA